MCEALHLLYSLTSFTERIGRVWILESTQRGHLLVISLNLGFLT